MALELVKFVLGPLQNNAFILADPETREAALVDPPFGTEAIKKVLDQKDWQLKAIWLTHAHFDHFGGAGIAAKFGRSITIGIHPLDLPLWRDGGGAKKFGFAIHPGPEPTFFFADNQILSLGKSQIEVRHAPGHSPGHVLFYISELSTALVGDVVFLHGVGRTDLPGGSEKTLYHSISTKVFTLPDSTRIFPGHGEETTVQEEKRWHGIL